MELQLSKKQMDKIEYESMLLRMSPQQLYVVAPHLFVENITSANTESKSVVEDLKEQAQSYLDSLKEDGGIYGY
jgi:hypothetical protein